MFAKYYLYRNLHTQNFSIKFRGKVIAHEDCVILKDTEFKVSDIGRDRVRREKRKNVHATVAAKFWSRTTPQNLDKYSEIFYNPYYTDYFQDENGVRINKAESVLCQNNKIYIRKN